VQNSMTSSDPQASQPKSKTMSLIAELYANREKFPLQAEPTEEAMPKPQGE